MTIVRHRPAYTDEQLKKVYSRTYDHTNWFDHVMRIQVSIGLLHSTMPSPRTVADLSCGDGVLIDSYADFSKLYKGDFVPGYEFCGKIEDTINQIPHVDLFIMSETLEHLDDPLSALQAVGEKANILFLSTPDSELTDINPEHYWGWDTEGIEELFSQSGWVSTHLLTTRTRDSRFQIWVARRGEA